MWPHSEEGWEPLLAHLNPFKPTANTALHLTASGYTSLSQLAPLFFGTPAVAIILRISEVYVDDSPNNLALRSCLITSFAVLPSLSPDTCDLAITSAVTSSSTSYSNHPSSSHCLLNSSHWHYSSMGWRTIVQHRAWILFQPFVITSLLNQFRCRGLPLVSFFVSRLFLLIYTAEGKFLLTEAPTWR